MKKRKYVFFTDKETEGLKDELCVKLDKARKIADTPFRITSGLRLLGENEQLSFAAKNSAHLDGLAVDLGVSTSGERFKIVRALLEVGFTRIGIYDKHVHCDLSKTNPAKVLWLGVSH